MKLNRSQIGAKVIIKKHGIGSNAFYTVSYDVNGLSDKQFRSTYTKALAYRKRLIEQFSA